MPRPGGGCVPHSPRRASCHVHARRRCLPHVLVGGSLDRHGSIPPTATHLLQDDGSSQTLDGEAHQHRKRMFLEMMEPPERERMQQVFIEEWNDACRRWQKAGSVILHEELQHLLTRTAMRSAGFDLTANDVESRAFEFSSMIENAGRVGPRNWMARTLRFRTEHRARGVIDSVRDGSMDVPAGSALARLAAQTELDGQLLHSEIAAVELLNTIRLVVAISRFIVFAALCTEQIPRWHALFSSGVEDDLANIVTEVRRHAPFFPVMGGRVRRPFEWHGHRSRRAKGVARPNGTNHDQRIWSEPNRFRPERFRNWPGTPVHADSS